MGVLVGVQQSNDVGGCAGGCVGGWGERVGGRFDGMAFWLGGGIGGWVMCGNGCPSPPNNGFRYDSIPTNLSAIHQCHPDCHAAS